MHLLKMVVRAFCLIAFLTGAVDMFAGVHLLIVGGAHLRDVTDDAVLNSQVGFRGAIWFGFGVILWRASAHLRDEANSFRILCAIIALSGLARLGAAIVYGLPGPVLTGAMILELVTGVGLLAWHTADCATDFRTTIPKM